MSTLAIIRASGVWPTLQGDGLALPPATPPGILDQLREHKPQIIATLSAEIMDGINYSDSPLYVLLSRHFDDWYMQCDSDERTQALSLLSKWDEALWLDLTTGAKLVTDEWPIMARLMENRPLSGKALVAAAQCMADAIPRPIAVKPAEPPPALCLIATPSFTVPKPEPRQEGFGFFDPLPKPAQPAAQTAGGDASVFD